MLIDTEQRMQTTMPAETAAKPPPDILDEKRYQLFQTMEGLRSRHGEMQGTKDRLVHAAAAIIGGSVLFAALYALILFLE